MSTGRSVRIDRRILVAATAGALLAGCSGSASNHGEPAATTTSPAPTTLRERHASPPPDTGPSATTGHHPTRVTVVMSGDVLLHEGLWTTARVDAQRTGRQNMDFRPLLADMRPVVRGADLAICHLETPLAPAGGPYSGYPLFAVPPAILPALKWEGYDACTTASNHSLDQGFAGLKRTIADFDRVGLAHAGTAATKRASRHALMLRANGVSVALISATYGTNGIPTPSEEPWSVPLIDTGRILRMAHRARANGAQIVLVALHWGQEYQRTPSPDQVDIANRLTKSPDITLIYGHHAHVVQPYDRVHGTWVVYGLGNAVAQQSTDVEGVYDGNTCRVTFAKRPDGSFGVRKLEYIPTMITHFDQRNPARDPMRWLDVPKHVHDPAFASLRSKLRGTNARVTTAVDIDEALSHGVVEGG